MTAEAARYLDEAATAQRLSVSTRTLQRWRRNGGGPAFIRAGVRRVIYDAAQIERWVASRTFAHHAAELTNRSA
jgi:predicted DNA-binding transcriptional regulator AlpA